MSYVNKSVQIDIKIELEEFEEKTLVQAYKILKNIAHDMCEEELEDTEEAFDILEARDSLEVILRYLNVNLEDCRSTQKGLG